MSPLGVLLTPRTVSAIQKADALSRNMIPGPHKRSTPPVFAGDAIRLAKITAKTNTYTYTADIYGNPDAAAEETDATIKVNTDQLADGETIPNDTLLEVRKQNHGSPSATKYWTVIGLARSY